MSENKDEGHLDIPAIIQKENSSEELTPAADTGIINPNQETENMEVHHHTHPSHGKKTWKSYFKNHIRQWLRVDN